MDALAMKPFCSGSREDVHLLQAVQPGQLEDQEANPFFFRKPLAPLVAARAGRRIIRLREALDRIRRIAARCDLLLVEGAGGLLAPLGEGFTAAELIRDLKAHVCVVAANKLGTINHTLLTARALASFSRKSVSVILTATTRRVDSSSASNESMIAGLLSPIPVWSLPYLGKDASSARKIQGNFHRTAKVWAALLDSLQK
jgi:dethiobiotin synthetase